MSYLRHFEELGLETSVDILDGVIEAVLIRGKASATLRHLR